MVVLGVVLFGPEKLPDLARKLARVVNYLRGIANNARTTLSDELGPEFATMDLRDLHPRTFVAKHLLSGDNEVVRGVREVAGEVKSAKTPLPRVSPSVPSSAGETSRRSVAFDPEAT